MRGIVGVLAVLAVAGCSSSNAPDVVTGRGDAPYTTTADILAALKSGGAECEAEGKPFTTVYSLRSQHCYLGRVDVTVAVYASDGQLDDARVFLPESDPAAVYVFGDQWSAKAPNAGVADKIRKAMS